MKPLKVYACYNEDKNVRICSSSGAVFFSLAEYVFEHKGVVYGVAMSEDCYSAEFISVTEREGLIRLQGSKYLQAKVGDTFKAVKNVLLDGRIVLFTGTGCQINGLKNFLEKDYNNLICVDVICHGVPSPTLWKKYVQYQEEKYGKLIAVNFRCKDESWMDFGMKELFEGISGEESKQLYISKDKDSYMQMFLRDYCLRPSCYDCTAKKDKMSDLTIADFWGINKVASDMNDGMGTSLVLVRSNKGEEIFECISEKLKIKEVSYEAAIKENTAELRSCTKPTQRETFFDDMHSISFEELEKKYATPSKITFKKRFKRKIKLIIKNVFHEIGMGE